MQSLVSGSCAVSGCHNGTQSPDYRNITEANMKADTTARAQVAAGLMPQGTTLTTAQKAIFANFYQ